MTTAYESLIGLAEVPAAEHPARAELEPLWLRAANERLVQQRERIHVLGRAVDEIGITEIRAFDDLVPLLFAHSNYKSYPEGFIAKGRWDLMNKWLDTLSSVRVDKVDAKGVSNQYDWVDRLHAAKHMVYVTSGTTGKNSFIPATPFDERFSLRALSSSVRTRPAFANGKRLVRLHRAHERDALGPRSSAGRTRPAFANGKRLVIFILGPKYGAHRAALHFRTLVEEFGRPDASYFLTEEPMRVSDISRMAELRRKMAAGTAMPNEIATFERETKARQEEMAARLDGLSDKDRDHATQ